MAQLLSTAVTSTAYKITKTVVGIECDVCNKVIPTKQYYEDASKYYEITTGHHDWGAESIESREAVDVCPECVAKYISDYLKDASTTGYLELRTEYSYPEKHSTVVDKMPKEGEITRKEHDYY